MANDDDTQSLPATPLITPERREVIRLAICENCGWLDLVRKMREQQDFEQIAATIFARMDVLNTVILSGIDEDLIDDAELAFMLEPAGVQRS